MKKVSLLILCTLLSIGLCLSVAFASDYPSWYPAEEDVEGFEEYTDPDRAQVVDDADIFTDEEEEYLSEKINELIDNYGIDFVIFTDDSTYGFEANIYAADFFVFNGYGLGSDNNGTILLISMEPGNRCWYTASHGEVREYYTESNINHIDDAIQPSMVDGDYYGAMITYIDEIEYMYANDGQVNAEYEDYYENYDYDDYNETNPWFLKLAITALVIAIIISLIIAGSKNKKDVKNMNKVAVATTADANVKNNLFLTENADIFLYMTVVRTRIPKDDDHKGGSSFSGGFSSSSGSSFSGGGRSF